MPFKILYKDLFKVIVIVLHEENRAFTRCKIYHKMKSKLKNTFEKSLKIICFCKHCICNFSDEKIVILGPPDDKNKFKNCNTSNLKRFFLLYSQKLCLHLALFFIEYIALLYFHPIIVIFPWFNWDASLKRLVQLIHNEIFKNKSHYNFLSL